MPERAEREGIVDVGIEPNANETIMNDDGIVDAVLSAAEGRASP